MTLTPAVEQRRDLVSQPMNDSESHTQDIEGSYRSLKPSTTMDSLQNVDLISEFIGPPPYPPPIGCRALKPKGMTLLRFI